MSREFNKQQNGGMVTAIKFRSEALFNYYNNPNKCLECDQIIQVPENVKCSVIRKKKFCTSSCSAKYNNKHRTIVKKVIRKEKIKTIKAKLTIEEIIIKKYNSLNITKKEFFDNCKSWQSARSVIQRSARFIYNNLVCKKECLKCHYNNHYEVCHIKSVSSFDDKANILNEINNVNNLIALCPNHHWEFDNGLLTINMES